MDASELESLDANGCRYELVSGALRVMSPAGGLHGRIALRIAILLGNHVDQQRLGVTLAAETGFRISTKPDTVIAPDAAYVSWEKYSAIVDEAKFIPFAPDLAVEVMSPSDKLSDCASTAELWLHAGCLLTLVVDPDEESVHQFRPRCAKQSSRRGDLVDCSDVVAGWKFSVDDIF